MKRRILALLLVFAMMAAMLAGCSSKKDSETNDSKKNESSSQQKDNSSQGKDSSSQEQANSSQENKLTESTEASASAVIRDVVNVGIQSDPADFAPWGANTVGRISALWGIYEPLVNFVNGVAEPVLLKEYKIADDGMSLSGVLYENITDSAGNALKASDVKFSYDKGIELGLIASTSFVDEVVVTGDYTFDIKFNRKLGIGEEQTLLETWFVVTEASYTASPDGLASNPVGTGPYKMTSYTPNYMFTYTARDDYWQEPDKISSKAKQNTKTINYYIISEPSQRTTALETGQIDICDAVSSDDLFMFEEGGELSEDYKVVSVPDFRSMFVFPNLMEGTKTADDLNLRMAILYAVDAAMVCQSVFNGKAEPNYSFSPSFGIGFLDKWKTEDNFYTNASFDKAKEYLAKSNYDGSKLILLTETTDIVSDTALIVMNCLMEAGMDIELLTVESTVMRTYMQSGDYDVMVTRNGITSYAVQGYVNVLDGSKWKTGSVNNIGDPKVQELLNAARSNGATDENLDELHQYIIDNAYGRCICNYYLSYVVPKYMKDVVASWRAGIMPGSCTYTE